MYLFQDEMMHCKWGRNEKKYYYIDAHEILRFPSEIKIWHFTKWNSNVSPGHIILIPSQPVFALNHKCCVLSEEAANTNLVWLDLGLNSKSTTLEAVLWHVDNLLFLYMFIFSPCDVTKASWSQTNFRQMKNKFLLKVLLPQTKV